MISTSIPGILAAQYGKTWSLSTVGDKTYYNNLLTKQSYDLQTKKKVSFNEIVGFAERLGKTAAEVIRALNTAQTPEQINALGSADMTNLLGLQQQQQTQTKTWYYIGGGVLVLLLIGALIYFKR